MKKIIYILFFVFLLSLPVITLSSCHKASNIDAFQLPSEFDASKEYEISFWAKNDSNATQKNIYQRAINAFEEIYPNIHVTMKSYTNYQDIYNDVITNISTNTTPNVCISYPDHVATYLTGNNVIVQLDDLMEDYNYGFGGAKILYESVKQEELIGKFMEECKLYGSTYLIPFMRSSEACYVNKTIIDSIADEFGEEYNLPDKLTWDYIWKVCKKEMEIKEAKQTMIPLIYKSTDNMMIQMLRQKSDDISINGNYSTNNGDILIFNDTTKDILSYIDELATIRGMSTFAISSYPGNYLNTGSCIFGIDSTAGATWMGSSAPMLDVHAEQVVPFEMKVMEVPQFDLSNPKMISQGPSLCIFNKENNQEVLASWLFAQYLLTNKTQIDYSQTEGYVPVTKKALNSYEYQDYLNNEGNIYKYTNSNGEEVVDKNKYYAPKIQASKIVLANIDKTFVTPVFNGSTALRQAAGELIENLIKSRRRNQNVDYDEMFDSVSKLYKLDQIETIDSTTNSVQRSKKTLGPLPKISVIIIIVFILAWILIGIYYLIEIIKNKKIQ